MRLIKDLDMPKISEEFSSNFLKATDLGGDDLTLKIEDVAIEQFKEDDGSKRKKVVLSFSNHDAKMVCNATNRDSLVELFGDDTDDWIGKRIVLYSTRVQFGSKRVDAIRIREKNAPAKGKPEKQAAAVSHGRHDEDDEGDDENVPF